MGRVDGAVDQGLVRTIRHGNGEGRACEAAADAEYQIRFIEKMPHRCRYRNAARAQCQRVVLVERALAAEAGADRDRQPLGQRLQRPPGLGPMDALTGIDHRPFGVRQRPGRRLNGSRLRSVSSLDGRSIIQRFRDLFIPDIDRNFDQDRAAATILELGEGTAKYRRHLLGTGDRLGRFGDARHRGDAVEIGRHMAQIAGIAHGHHQHRHGLTKGLCDAAKSVFRTRPVLHDEDTDLAA